MAVKPTTHFAVSSVKSPDFFCDISFNCSDCSDNTDRFIMNSNWAILQLHPIIVITFKLFVSGHSFGHQRKTYFRQSIQYLYCIGFVSSIQILYGTCSSLYQYGFPVDSKNKLLKKIIAAKYRS